MYHVSSIIYHISRISIKQFEILFKTCCTIVKNETKRVLLKWTKKLLKIALVVLDAVKSRFPETQEFIENTVREECEKEKMAADEVIFLLLNLQKKLAWINLFGLDLVL